MYELSETASDSKKRFVFHSVMAKVLENPAAFDGMIFDRVDRSSRNPSDQALIWDLQKQHGVTCYSVRERINTSTPSGRFQWANLAGTAAYETDNRSEQIIASRKKLICEQGKHLNRPPYGYLKVRGPGKSIRCVPEQAQAVKRAFELFAHGPRITINDLADRLQQDGYVYRPDQPRFEKNGLHYILKNRFYLGLVKWKENDWYAGEHDALVDRQTFERAQRRIGNRHQSSHEHVFGAERVTCGICNNHALTPEPIKKTFKSGRVKVYRYYRCASTKCQGGRSPHRATEQKLEVGLRAFFAQLRLDDEYTRDFFVRVLREKAKSQQHEGKQRHARLSARLTKVRNDKDRLIHLRMADEITGDELARMKGEMIAEESEIQDALRLTGLDQSEQGEQAVSVFELSQALTSTWDRTDMAAKHMILDTVCLNLTWVDGSLSVTARSPFDLLAKGAGVQIGGPCRT